MTQVLVHNITDRPNVDRPPYAFHVLGEMIRPGGHILVESSLLTKRLIQLHGRVLWIGELPDSLSKTSQSALRSVAPSTVPMTIDEARDYLSGLGKEVLLELCSQVSPALEFSGVPSTKLVIVKLSRALFSDGRVPNPEAFLWLRRWAKKGNTYVERE